MTPQQAEKILTEGCPHNPWSDDVCGGCAKDILEVLANLQFGRKPTAVGPCRSCGDPTHTTTEHTSWTAFGEDELD